MSSRKAMIPNQFEKVDDPKPQKKVKINGGDEKKVDEAVDNSEFEVDEDEEDEEIDDDGYHSYTFMIGEETS